MTVHEDIVTSLRSKSVTRIIGHPTNAAVDLLQEELAKIAATVKTTLIEEGNKFGHLAVIVPEDNYKEIIKNRRWTYHEPTHPGYYDASITANMPEVEAKAKEAEHKEKLRLYQVFLGVEQALREKIEGAVDYQHIAALDEEYVGYSGSTPLDMIEHIRKGCCKITNADREDLDKEFRKEWDQSDNITTYFRQLELIEKKMKRWKMEVTEGAKVVRAVGAMYASELFDEKEMMTWENKTDNQKTWAAVKKHFGDLYQDKKRYTEAKAKKTGFGSIQNVEETKTEMIQDDGELREFFDGLEDAVRMDKEHINQMASTNEAMVKLTQQLTAQLAVANSTVETVLKQNAELVALLAKHGISAGKAAAEVPPPDKEKKKRRKCTHCKKWTIHKDEECYTLEANKDKRPSWWK